MIEIKHLSKRFDAVQAVDDLSFRVSPGELFAFLGLNGAGKSTTISIMCGQLTKDAGTVIIDENDLDRHAERIKQEIGVVYQTSVLDRALNAGDNLAYRAALYGITGSAYQTRIAELDRLLELKELLDRPLGKLSGGQRRRIDIARALLHRPKLLILDEPTTGLDPQTRHAVWEVVESLRRESGMTVFLTTHYMEEAADADHVVILDSGKIVAEGTPLELKNTYTGDFITLYGVTEEQALRLSAAPVKLHDGYRIAVADTAEATKLILAYPEIFIDYEITKGKMDDVFLQVTGKKLTGGDEK